METVKNNLKYRMLAVKIILHDPDTVEKPLGSGALFIRGIGEEALVFTTPHIFPEIRKRNNYRLILSIKDESIVHKIENDFSIKKDEEENKAYRIYYHDSFDLEKLKNDAAIITIPWENWMEHYQLYEIGEVDLNTEVIGWGFPGAMNEEGSLPSDQTLSYHLSFNENNRGELYITLNEKNTSEDNENDNGEYRPEVYFSTAQLNTVAFSSFLGRALDIHTDLALNSIFIDDPIGSFDDMNVLGFADLMRSIIENSKHQIIISTHDEKVFRILKRKLDEDYYSSCFLVLPPEQ